MDFDSALPIFEEEARELLVDMEKCLLAMEAGENNKDLVNSIFRAVHTIKGSGGMFGLDKVVAFSHHVETLMDEVRQDKQQLSTGLISVLMQCGDHIGNLVSESLGQGMDAGELAKTGDALLASLAAHSDGSAGAADHVAPAVVSVAVAAAAPVVSAAEADTPVSAQPGWQVHIKFGEGVMREGVDPMSVISYLSSLGSITSIHTTLAPSASIDSFDPQSCYIETEMIVSGDLDEGQISSAFEFIHDQSEITIVRELSHAVAVPAPHSAVAKPAEVAASVAQAQAAPAAVAAPVKATPKPAKEAAKETAQASKGSSESRFIRVEAKKLDQLIDLIGELVISGESNSLVANRVNNQEMVEAASSVSSLVESIRDSALSLRMIPIGNTFDRFNRLVRELSIELDKDIDLQISGAETELDKSVVEKITDPLTHLVRNSIDHGIEKPADRLAAGKSAQATLQLHAYHDSGSIVIEVGDDGKGLDKEKIRNTAIKRGLISESAVLTDDEVKELIFQPGFSTAEAVTNLSGRGVGMDVVRQNILSLRGTVEMETLPGVGTISRIRLPLTLAIIDGFLVKVGIDSYVIPLSLIVECVELSKNDVETNQGRNYINLRGEVLPFVRIRDVFKTDSEPAERENIIVVNYAGRSAGLVVDELLGNFQTVIKPLGPLFGSIKGVSGSTILGNGDVGLILDVPSLIQLVTQQESIISNEAYA